MHQANHSRTRPQGFELARSAIASPRVLWYNWLRPQVYHSHCFIQLDGRAFLRRAVAPGCSAGRWRRGHGRMRTLGVDRSADSGTPVCSGAWAPGHPGACHHRACPFTCPLTTAGPWVGSGMGVGSGWSVVLQSSPRASAARQLQARAQAHRKAGC